MEESWISGYHPVVMLSPELVSRLSDRKLALFAIACCRRAWAQYPDQLGRRAMDITESLAENSNSPQDWDKAATAGGRAWATASARWEREHLGERALPATVVHVVSELGAAVATRQTGANGPLSQDAAESWFSAKDHEHAAQAELLRHIVGNPFKSYPAPATWPFAVVELAKALFDGNGDRLVLADALEEAGHGELAEHFRSEEWHPKGCFAMDLMLGKS